MNTDELLAERRKSHGDFAEHARITQNLKAIMRDTANWDRLSAVQRESLEMNAHKVGRILAGNPDIPDHWDDIAGYSRLVSQRVSLPRKGALDGKLLPTATFDPPDAEI